MRYHDRKYATVVYIERRSTLVRVLPFERKESCAPCIAFSPLSPQIVEYDSRRRMHRCAYDVTGEKHWHNLKTKRFEIVGRNGVLVRSSESAPTAISPSRF